MRRTWLHSAERSQRSATLGDFGKGQRQHSVLESDRRPREIDIVGVSECVECFFSLRICNDAQACPLRKARNDSRRAVDRFLKPSGVNSGQAQKRRRRSVSPRSPLACQRLRPVPRTKEPHSSIALLRRDHGSSQPTPAPRAARRSIRRQTFQCFDAASSPAVGSSRKISRGE